MSVEKIKQMLDSGTCPECQQDIHHDADAARYTCSADPSHFTLEVKFQGGEGITATLNGAVVPAEELKDIDW